VLPESALSPEAPETMRGLKAEVETLRSELAEARAKAAYLERLADQDTLVPVINRRAFTRELSRTMSYARRYQVPCSVLYFDLNELKEINDTYGHGAGDAALVRIAETLVGSVREFDIVGRLGGDEFGVILVHVDGQGAAEKAASLAAAVEASPLVYRGIDIAVSVAFGSYQFRPDESVDRAIDAADRAMYARKRHTPDA
jgi:diguanylate cyclase (GGDEF)-like protein